MFEANAESIKPMSRIVPNGFSQEKFQFGFRNLLSAV